MPGEAEKLEADEAGAPRNLGRIRFDFVSALFEIANI